MDRILIAKEGWDGLMGYIMSALEFKNKWRGILTNKMNGVPDFYFDEWQVQSKLMFCY